MAANAVRFYLVETFSVDGHGIRLVSCPVGDKGFRG
jgi:hypothetical protein